MEDTPYKLLKYYFSITELEKLCDSKISEKNAKGIDRINGLQFKNQSKEQIAIIHRKCTVGKYKFSPYLELLRSKGRDKKPRLLAIPTIRDRLVLYALKEVLFRIFPECIASKLANTYIYDIKDFIEGRSLDKISIFHADIENFYGSIDREIIYRKISTKVKSQKLLTLIKNAIETPTVPKNYRNKDIKQYKENIGIPQGLPISNILAAIYLYELDCKMIDSRYKYFRYMDDILVFTSVDIVDEVEVEIRDEVENKLKMSFNRNKTGRKSAKQDFTYLGYHFKLPLITVKESSVEKFLLSITAKFTDYMHNREKRLKDKTYLDSEKIKQTFINILNEKITGAISDNRRYGWIFYFNAINDLSLLYKMDKIIASLFGRLTDFDRKAPANLKKLSKTYYQSKYNPLNGYIHNYDNYKTYNQKIEFLSAWGMIDPQKSYSEKEIDTLYEKTKRKNLSELEKDDAFIY